LGEKVMERKLVYLWCVIAVLVAVNVTQFVLNSNRLFTDAVPNEETASTIAEVVLISVYGDDVQFTKPYSVTYNKVKKAWIVTGNLPEPQEGQLINGGVPEIIIRKRDGRIMKISHGM